MLQNRRALIIIFTVLLLAAAVIYTYFAVYQPLALDIETAERELKSEEKLIEALENKTEGASAAAGTATGTLQQELPVKPMTDKLLLDFEKVELLSGSLITDIAFAEGEAPAVEQGEEQGEEAEASETQANEEADTADNSEADEQATDMEEDGEQPAAAPAPEVLPPGIKKISAQLTVESLGYFEMKKFLAKLEQQIRIIEIEQLTFDGPEELEKLEGTDEPLRYDVTIAAYYMPELLSLMQDVPKVDSPAPAKKEDPFVKIND